MNIVQHSVNENKRTIINLIANTVSYTTTLIISFILTPYLINTLGKEAYSFYPLANNFISYMSILMNALNTMASRFITVNLVKNEYDKANKYFSSVLFSNIIMSGILLIPMFLIVLFIDKILTVPFQLLAAVRSLFTFSFASMIVNIITSVFGVATFAKNRIDLRSFRELATSILRLALFYILFSYFTPSIVYVGIVAFIIASVNFIIQCWYTKILLPEITIGIRNFNWFYIKEVLAAGTWSSINSLGNILLTSSSLIMVNIFYGAEAGGEYSIIQTVPNFINGLISMLTGVFFPLITIAYAKNDKKKLVYEVNKSQTIVGFFSTSVIGVFVGVSTIFFRLWVPGENAERLFILSSLTILPHCVIGCVWAITNLNVAMNKIKIPALYLLCSGVINIMSVLILHRFFNLDMIVIPICSSIIQIIWVGIFLPLYASYQLSVPFITFLSPVFRGIVCTFIAYFLSSFVTMLANMYNWINFFGYSIMIGTIVLIINFFIMLKKETRKIVFSIIGTKIMNINRIK